MEILSDSHISDLVSIKKVADRQLEIGSLRASSFGHKKANFEVVGIEGSKFKVKIRQSPTNVLDFSIILSYYSPTTNVSYNLRRYNGNSHRHINAIEGDVIDHKFHIHRATERYQRLGKRIDDYATETREYSSIDECLIVFKRDCNITDGDTTETRLDDYG